MKLFQQKSIEQLQADLLQQQVNSNRSKGLIKTLFLTAIAAATVLVFAPKTPECVGVCSFNEGASIAAKGYMSSQVDDKRVYSIDYKSAFSVASSEGFAEIVDVLAPRIKKGDIVMLNIESAGGAVVSCGHSYDQVMKLKAYGAKVVASTDYMALSCGYQLAAAADVVVAASAAQVGNIGAVMIRQKSLSNAAVEFMTGGNTGYAVGSTRTKEILSGDWNVSTEEKEIIRELVQNSANDFFDRVLATRGNKIVDKDEAFSAKPFNAKMALKLGLIDQISDNRSLKQTFLMNGYTIHKVVLNKPSSLFDELTSGFKSESSPYEIQ